MVLNGSEVSDLKKLLIIGIACHVTVLFVVWKTFHKNLLDVYYDSAFLLIVIYIYIYTYMSQSVFISSYSYIY